MAINNAASAKPTTTLDRAEMLLTRNTLDAESLVDSVLAPDFFRDRLVAGFFAARLFVVETPAGVGFCGVIIFLDTLDPLAPYPWACCSRVLLTY